MNDCSMTEKEIKFYKDLYISPEALFDAQNWLKSKGEYLIQYLTKWDLRYLELAKFISSWSKDPSLKVGAVIADKDNRVVSLGFNGFARGVHDDENLYKDRDYKLKAIIHAEINAILFAKQQLNDCTLYTYPLPPCSNCSSLIIQSGVKRIVAPIMSDSIRERWGKSCEIAEKQFKETKVDLILVDFK